MKGTPDLVDDAPGLNQSSPRVRRPRLEHLLDAVPPGGSGLLVASAGSGKSVLLEQWAASRPDMSVCALNLAPRHNDAVAFAGALLEALSSAPQPVDNRLAALLMTGGNSLGEPFIEGLLGELEAQPIPFVIVFDDAHVLTNRALVREFAGLIGGLPERVRVLLAARWDPSLGLSALRLDGRLVDIRAADLAFDRVEAGELVRSVSGRALTAELTHLLVERTDGWAAGLQLAAISLHGSSDATAFVEAFAGTDRLVVEYLTQEVLDTLDEPTRRFLLRTSVLPWLSVELCDAVTGTGNARETLNFLQQRSLFLVPLDMTGERFRYHHLFADLLRYQLRAEDPSSEADLVWAAAEWLAVNGHTADAIEQLLAGREPWTAFGVILERGHLLFERGESATLVRWLSQIQRDTTDDHAVVGVNLLAAQIAANQFVPAAETYRRLHHRSDLTVGERAAADALYSCLAIDDLASTEVTRAASAALDSLPRIDDADITNFLGIGGRESIHALAEFTIALAQFFDGDVAAGGARLERIATLPGASYATWKVNILGGLALMRAWQGRLIEAQQLAKGALDAAGAAGLTQHPATANAFAALGLVGIERQDMAMATLNLSESGARIQRGRGASFADLQRLLSARLTAVTEGPRQSLDVLVHPDGSAIGRPILACAQRVLHAHLLLADGDPVQARLVLRHVDQTPEAACVLIDVELADGNVPAARRELDRWIPGPDDLTQMVEHLIRTAAVLEAEGHHAAARAAMLDAVTRAEVEGLCRPFLDHQSLLRPLSQTARRSSQTFLRSLLEAATSAEARRSGQSHLIEPLTQRELAVLEFLPSRMTNHDISDALYVSVNTVKTHLRNIYRKLDVADRDAAVERAGTLGLL